MNDRHSGICRRTEFGLQTCSLLHGLRNVGPSKLQFVNLKESVREMANRKGVFIGAYVPNHLKESLRRRAAAEHRTLSQEITRILEEAVHGRGLPAGSIDRRNKETSPRRRGSDPAPRRRAIDVAYMPSGNKSGDDKA